jgi:hypothetical protein
MNVEPQQITDEVVTALYLENELSVNELDHLAWTEAAPNQITRKWNGEDAPASRHAEARIIWSDESLVVRFVCRQEEPLIVSSAPQVETKTIGLWNRDVCEIFIAPDIGAPERYFEFEAAPTGEWVDLAINFKPAGRATDFDWQSGMTAAANIQRGEITIAMRIPWNASIPKPMHGDVWGVNLFRCVGLGNDRYLAWRPTYAPEPNFHLPEAFGRLAFA